METPELERRTRQWLEAELEGREAEAERLLAGLFRHLPEPSLSPGFSTAVLARLQPVTAAPWWRLEVLAAGLLVAVALSLAIAPLWVARLWEALRLLPWQEMASAAGGVAVSWLATVVRVWSWLVDLGGWALVLWADPRVMTLLAACGLVATLAGRLLYELLNERRATYARG
jgi:hypothetical protein